MRLETRGQAARFLPYEVDIARGTLSAVDMTGSRMREPFYVQSLEARLGQSPYPLEVAGEIDTVLAICRMAPHVPIRGAIFHTGRCGSTLLANALSEIDRLLVMKEPPLTSSLAVSRLASETPGRDLTALTDWLTSEGLPATRTSQDSAIVKFTSWNVLALQFWTQLLQESPSIFLWRPCAEVISSISRTPAGWAIGAEYPQIRDLLDTWASDLLDAGIDRLPANLRRPTVAWLHAATKGLEIATNGGLVMSYDSLVGDFRSSLALSLRHFGMQPAEHDLDHAAQVTRWHAKDPSRRTGFQPRPTAGDSPLAAVPQIAEICHEVERELSALTSAIP